MESRNDLETNDTAPPRSQGEIYAMAQEWMQRRREKKKLEERLAESCARLESMEHAMRTAGTFEEVQRVARKNIPPISNPAGMHKEHGSLVWAWPVDGGFEWDGTKGGKPVEVYAPGATVTSLRIGDANPAVVKRMNSKKPLLLDGQRVLEVKGSVKDVAAMLTAANRDNNNQTVIPQHFGQMLHGTGGPRYSVGGWRAVMVTDGARLQKPEGAAPPEGECDELKEETARILVQLGEC